MKLWNYPSLRVRLTWRLVAIQALVLIIFTLLATTLVLDLISADQGLDDDIVEHIADSIERDSAGGLKLVLDDVTKDTAEHPQFWFYATDIDGNTVQLGNIPATVRDLLDDLPRLNAANIAAIGPERAPSAIVRRADSNAGSLWIITGGGPGIGPKTVVANLGEPFFIALLSILSLASFLVIPLVVSSQLKGVAHVAAEADRIDIDQRGIRLSSAHVPEELHSLVRAVNSALQRLDNGMERRQRFLVDAAHELRTPIAILQSRIELLPSNDRRAQMLLDVARLTNLANQLLDQQRLDGDQTVLQPMNLADLAAEVTADLAPLVLAAGSDISFDAEEDAILVMGDAPSLSRAIVNLVQNALVHGGPSVAIRVTVIRSGALRVRDTGPGIAQEHRDFIFEPFNRIYPRNQGVGLGLNLVRDIVARHHGRIRVGDAPEGGALFEISLPLAGKGRSARDAGPTEARGEALRT